MAKSNIYFNNKNYSIDDSSLSSAANELKSYLSTTMSGSGATINFGGAPYNVDFTKLSSATNDFVSHLGTISGSGTKIIVGGVERFIDSAKVSTAVSELEEVLGSLSSGGSNPDVPSEERLEGDGQKFHKLAPSSLTFRSTAPLNELQSVQINGVTVDPSNYTLEEGSTIVTLPIEYLKTLNADSYDIAVVSENKTAKGGFSVVEPDLNEHGFYYNQPYAAHLQYSYTLMGMPLTVNDDFFFMICEDGTAIYGQGQNVKTATVAYNDGVYTLTMNTLVVKGAFSFDGKTFECIEVKQGSTVVNADSFLLCDIACSDEEFVYLKSNTGYLVYPISKTRATYGVIPTNINNLPVISIGKYAFEYCNNLETVGVVGSGSGLEIPNCVTNIGYGAFYECANLKSVTIPDSVTGEINSDKFSGCENITNLTIGNGITSIGSSAFEGFAKLKTLTIGDGVTSISADAFKGCGELENVVLGAGVNSINITAFRHCPQLTSFVVDSNNETYCSKNNCLIETASKTLFFGIGSSVIPSDGSVTTIGDSAFAWCMNLTNIIIPDCITTISDSAFYECKKLETAILPLGLVTIPYGLFQNCESLKSIEIPSSVTNIEKFAMNGCNALNSITFAGTMEQWNSIVKEANVFSYGVPATYVQCSDGQVAR